MKAIVGQDCKDKLSGHSNFHGEHNALSVIFILQCGIYFKVGLPGIIKGSDFVVCCEII